MMIKPPTLFHDLVLRSAMASPDAVALTAGRAECTYGELADLVSGFAAGLVRAGVERRTRVAVYLPKTIETVAAMFGATAAGAVFIPVNPVLKGDQVGHILRDSGARVLVTSASRLAAMGEVVTGCPDLRLLVLVDDGAAPAGFDGSVTHWSEFVADTQARPVTSTVDADMAAILYTSGSTGMPKGVVLSHRNIVAGAVSVAEYLGNTASDRILSVLPLSFDAGMSQLTTGFLAGAQVVLMDYLMAGEVVSAVRKHAITGITGVPPLWSQLGEARWPEGAGDTLRYFASTGGVMPRPLLGRLREIFPKAQPFLMYGLTEAFRSTYLPPAEVDNRPDSIGKAIPNAEILVLREDGSECAAGEPGELVHRGALVSLGYWRNPEATAKRFRPLPGSLGTGGQPEIVVWSGDTVVRDEQGFLYFRGRRDEMIKTSGYRVSPEEVEGLVMKSGLVAEIVAVGVPDDRLGQAIVLVAVASRDDVDADQVLAYCREKLPAYMVPRTVLWRDTLPRNPNGKFDRVRVRREMEQG